MKRLLQKVLKVILLAVILWLALPLLFGSNAPATNCKITYSDAERQTWSHSYVTIHNGRRAWSSCWQATGSADTFGNGDDASMCEMDYSVSPAQLVCTRD